VSTKGETVQCGTGTRERKEGKEERKKERRRKTKQQNGLA
jgi:hypothetical protein